MLDNRAGRVLTPGARRMLPAEHWAWLTRLAHGDGVDHLVIGASLPWLMPHGIHHLEAAVEAWTDRPGSLAERLAEPVRRVVDLEHWAAFRHSFEAMGALLSQLSTDTELASISVLSGDVHHSYVARARFPGVPAGAPVHQLTCSPVHNQVPWYLRPVFRGAWSRGGAALGRALSRLARVPAPGLTWDRLTGPYFGNAVGTLLHTDRTAHVSIDGAQPDGTLAPVASTDLTAANLPLPLRG